MMFCIAAVTQAASPGDVGSLAKDFEATKKTIEQAEVKQRQILSALYQINKTIKKMVTEKGAQAQHRAFLEVSIRQLSDRVQELEQKSKEHRLILAERLRAIYKLGGGSIARYLFTSKSSLALETNLKILGVIAARDLELIKNYRRDLRELEGKKKTLAQRLEGMKVVERKIAAQEQDLLKEQDLKVKILDGVRKSKMFALKKINGLREQSLQFNVEDAGLFDILFKPSFADQKGSLPSPLSGVVTQKFGLMKGEDHSYTISNKGIFISAAQGSHIKSVFEGRVSFVGEVPGFGMTLVLDHGDHYYSVYSHARDIKVKVGDEIPQSHILAKVGEVPLSANPGLYFEIRHFSEPYDPQQWMKGL